MEKNIGGRDDDRLLHVKEVILFVDNSRYYIP